MLLLTDDLAEGMRLKQALDTYQPCLVVAVDQAKRRAPTYQFIICSSSSIADSKDTFKEALKYHRYDPNIPVVFLIDTTDPVAVNHANDLGATGVLSRDTPVRNLVFSLKLYRKAVSKSQNNQTQSSAAQTRVSVEAVGKSISIMFKDAAAGRAVSIPNIENGADRLIQSIKKTNVKEWIDIVRTYDDFTYQHCLLVAGLVATFSIRLGLSLEMQHCLAQAALVHDIGKAMIPLAILNKNGPLTGPERDVMCTHPRVGYQMITRQKDIHPTIRDVVLHHHEMLDGSGYPEHLKSSQISECARITTICDIYAALIERRPYRAPMPPSQARDVLVEMGGKLDVDFLQAFEQVACGL